MAASSAEALSLYRSFLRVSRAFPHYNIKEYIKRRAGEGFRINARESDPAAVEKVFSKAKADLELAKRQSAIYGFYERPHKGVLDATNR